MPWALIIAITTLIGLLFTKDKKPLPSNGGTWFIGLLLVWMSVTSLFALNPDSGEVLDRWIFAVKVLFMLFVTFMLLRGRRHIEWLLWAMVISVAFYGVKGGIWTLSTGGAGRVWGPPGGTLAGNNELAVGLVIMLPWMYYLREATTRRWLRMTLAVSMVMVAFGILGSQSRGALLAVLAMAIVLGWKSKNLVRTFVGLVVVAIAALVFMPESWMSRMDSIGTYETDTSAMSRIWAWQTLWNAALDRPLVGAGFRADNLSVFLKYAPSEGFKTFDGSFYVAHSIYLQALGEHGFVGLALYVGLGLWTWFAAGRLARTTRQDPEFAEWVPLLMRMTQASLLGFAVGGAFLSMMLVDVTYYIPGIVVLVQATVAERRKAIGVLPAVAQSSNVPEEARSHVLPGHTSA
jgi:probable O-glycosylation ligase (exosortase A-associated)